jgi:DNA-directed RNA polymerase subunit RPC12/RpoP
MITVSRFYKPKAAIDGRQYARGDSPNQSSCSMSLSGQWGKRMGDEERLEIECPDCGKKLMVLRITGARQI